MGTRVPQHLQDALFASTAGQSHLEVKDDAPRRARKQYTYTIGGFPSGTRFFAFANTMVNATTALLERVFYHEVNGVFTIPKDPSFGVVGAALKPFRRLLKFTLPRATPMERHNYVETTYRGRKYGVYKRAVEKLDQRGLLESDSFITTFLKWEKIREQPKRQVPRVIQPRAPEYNVELGRYLHPVEHSVYRAIDSVFGHPTVMKGLNSLEQGTCFHNAWQSFQRPVALCIDASRFDQHIRTSLLRWEHSIYDIIFSGDPYLRQLLRWQLKTLGFMRVDGKLMKYRVIGGRCSGDMNTAMGNILVACAGVYGWLHSVGLIGRVRVLDAGDDCVIIGETSDIVQAAPTLQPWFDANMGLIMKVEPLVYVLEQVSFCQTQPVYDGHCWRMVRDPIASLTKDATVIYAHHASDLKTYLPMIGQCGLSLTAGMPVLQEYYTAMGAETAKSLPVDDPIYDTGFFRLAQGMHEKYRPVSDEARVSFWRAFGIPPDLQVSLEEHYRKSGIPVSAVPEEGEVQRVDLGVGVAWCN